MSSSTPQITLYHYPGSTSTIQYLLLEYTSLPYTLQIINPSSPSFALTNPKKQVPVLRLDSDFSITENPAIAHAISQLAPEKHLFGKTPREFIRVCEWLNFLSASVHAQSWGPYVRPWRFTTDTTPEGEAGVKAAAERNVLAKWEVIESKLAQLPEGTWSVGDAFTAVDAFLFQLMRFARNGMGLDVEEQYPRWCALIEKVMEVQVLRKAMERDQVRLEKVGRLVVR